MPDDRNTTDPMANAARRMLAWGSDRRIASQPENLTFAGRFWDLADLT
jgi:hypothetical protein